MAKKRRKNSGRKTYFICLAVYTILLVGAAGFGLSVVWKYATEYEGAQAEPVVAQYVDHLNENLWDDSIAETIANMPHEVQSDEECAQYVQELLSNGISYNRAPSSDGGKVLNYELRCNNNVFGRLSLVEDQSYKDKVRFGMLPWMISKEEFDFNALYSSVSITVPKTYKVLLNGVELGPEYIVEEGIHYDVLEDYYDSFPDLPTKVTYQFDNVIGKMEPTVLDEAGNEVSVDESKDDSQFIKNCEAEELLKFQDFVPTFLERYFKFITGLWSYDKLSVYVEMGSELDQRMKGNMDAMGWTHTSSVRVDNSSLNSAVALGDGYYLLDVSATTTVVYPGKSNTGEVTNDQNMKIIVKDTAGEIRAISLEMY